MITAILRRIERFSRHSKLGLSFLLVMATGIIDYLTGSEASISIVYILPVSLASWMISRRSGIIMSIASAIVWYLADLLCSPSYSSPIVPFWNALVMFGFFAGAALTLSALRASLQREVALAREIQERFLPQQMPTIPGLDLTSAWLPARVVSGDYYDVIRIRENLVGFCIADVSGHGMHAALLMSNFQAAFRLFASKNPRPQVLCSRLNEFVSANSSEESFITFFYGVLDTKTHSLAYANAGHNNPILVRAGGSTHELEDGGIPLGMTDGFSYKEGNLQLLLGDLLLLYTDGVIELSDRSGAMFGVERLRDLLLEHRTAGAAAVRDSIMNAVDRFGEGNLEDDVTLLVLSLVDGKQDTIRLPRMKRGEKAQRRLP
jgi:hypothetical protein